MQYHIKRVKNQLYESNDPSLLLGLSGQELLGCDDGNESDRCIVDRRRGT